MAGVSGMNTDSMRRPSLELEDELPGAVGRQLIADDLWPPDRESALQLRPKLLRQVRHLVEVGDAVTMNPAIQLPCVEGVVAAFLQETLELGQVELAEVGRGEVIYLSRFL